MLNIFLLSMIFIPQEKNTFDIQGHRGCRAEMPENTVEGCVHAVELGVTTLELDVVITGDQKVLVSHEPWMSSEYCLDPSGKRVALSAEKQHNIYRMETSLIQQYDCGSIGHPRFPRQRKMRTVKPLLENLIDSVEEAAYRKGRSPIRYNIEIKSSKKEEGLFHPAPDVFVKAVMEVVTRKGISDRTIIQSFDIRILQELKKRKAPVTISLLVANVRSPAGNIRKLGFIPDLYCPYYKLIGKRQIARLHDQQVRVIPWTVNEADDMRRLIGMGVDGIITDDPALLIRILNP